jgi:orotate phosphoribosyltransferase
MFAAADKSTLAQFILDTAVKRGDFTLKSGAKSTWLVNLKESYGRPTGGDLCARGLLQALEDFPDVTHIGGVAYGGIPLMAQLVMAAKETLPNLGGFYVRKEKKDHGTGNLIDGVSPVGGRVVMVEDVTTTGGSVLSDVKTLRDMGIQVDGVIAVLNRGLNVEETLAGHNLKYRAVLTSADLDLD